MPWAPDPRLARRLGKGDSIAPMRAAYGSALVGALLISAMGCPKGPGDASAPPSIPTPAVATKPEPEPAPAEPKTQTPPIAPFDWARATTDGVSHLAVTVGQPAKRFAPIGQSGAATPEIVLHDEPPVRARAVYRESSQGEGEDSNGRWSLEITVGRDRWQIVDFATWVTDCAAVDEGFGRDGVRLEARDLVPGGAQEWLIFGDESHSTYIDDCDCTTRAGRSEHVWACGLVPEGKGKTLRPVCWAHVETSRDVGPSERDDCACMAGVAHEAWSLEAELTAPGLLRVTHDGRTDEHELQTLPCTLASPPAVFGCDAAEAAAAR
jgi:hypothetical protein